MSRGLQWLDGRLSGLAERNLSRRLARLGKRLDAVSGPSKSDRAARRETTNGAMTTNPSAESLDALQGVIKFFRRETPTQNILREIAKGLAKLERGMILDTRFWIDLHIAIEKEISSGGEDIV